MNELASIHGITADTPDLIAAVEELQLDQSDFRNRVSEVKKEVLERGFEAHAWYQPYHIWTEETWGIYIDARKLDDLALSFLDDFKAQRINGSHCLAALLAFGLTYNHEMFHAKVEATLSWMEITAGQPRHLRYKQRVYDNAFGTPQCLEEALANWSSWRWFQSPTIQQHLARKTNDADALARVAEASLDLSPPGYREWRAGHKPVTWRVFSTQLSSASLRLPSPGIALPLDSALTGPLPYDLLPSDVPLRFVGQGVIADRLLAHPATFNVPTKRKLEKALKFYNHIVDPSGGKGSHQKWEGPDQRAFILPSRDPVSHGVFKTFLQHVGIDKSTYVLQVRPML